MLGSLKGQAIDLYAGTGALGFEALSRGADHCVFVESDRAACRAIMANAEHLGVQTQIKLVSCKIEAARGVIGAYGPYDLILTDPPWTDMTRADLALGRLLRAELLTETGTVVLGHPKGRPVALPDSGLRVTKDRSWGDSAATFWCRDSAAGSL